MGREIHNYTQSTPFNMTSLEINSGLSILFNGNQFNLDLANVGVDFLSFNLACFLYRKMGGQLNISQNSRWHVSQIKLFYTLVTPRQARKRSSYPATNLIMLIMSLWPRCLSDVIDNPNQGMWYALQFMDPEGMFKLVPWGSESFHSNQTLQLRMSLAT